ncbi:hypothetical protein ACGFZQ_36530 [Streptomyces sp. NPDC048254]|uniref:hypothetical protein n=1 Tax=Streptomyces sp. NPDC048254 TaxID=3365525 RepID=UPI003717057B
MATYGSSGPVLGFNAEYDALPGLSQKRGVVTHDPLVYNYDAYGPTYGAGHGDAHNTLGAGGTAAAIAVAHAIRPQGLKATVKLFGSAGEEQLVGKAYAVKADVYDGLDAVLDWHPFNITVPFWNTTSALISATFTFLGASGHGGTPLGNKSGLDGALLMATMSEYLPARRASRTTTGASPRRPPPASAIRRCSRRTLAAAAVDLIEQPTDWPPCGRSSRKGRRASSGPRWSPTAPSRRCTNPPRTSCARPARAGRPRV